MKRVRRRILLTSALAVSALLLYIAAPRWTSIYLARKLSATFGRPTTVGQASYHFYPFELVAQDIRIGGPEFPDEPFLTVERVVLTPQIASFFQSRANLSQLRLEKPILHITAFLKGGDDLPSVSRRGEGGGLDIRRLTIVQGEFLLHHKRVPLELDLPNVTTQLSFGQGGTLTGRVLTGIGSIQVGSGPALNIGTDLDVTLDREALLVNSGRLRTARADLTYRGRIERRLPLGGLLQLAGQIDLAELDTHLWRTGFGIRGDADYQGTLEIVGPRLRLKGRMTGHSGEFDRVPVQKFAGGFSWDERGVRLDQLELATLGGSALLDIEIPPGSNPFRLKGTYRDVDSEGAIRAIFDLGALGVAASATGMVDLAWPKPRPRELSGRVVFDLSAGGDGRTPVNGQFVWHAEQGQQVIDRASLRSPTTEIAITGQIDPQRRIGWTLDGASADLAATDDLGLRLRRAMGAADAMLAGFTGRGRFRGACHGTLDLPEFTGRFSGDNVGLWGVTWGQAEWVGTATTTAVASHSLIVRRGGAEIWLDGLSETGDYGEQDALALKIKLESWPAEDFIKAFLWDLKMEGPVTGECALGGRRSWPSGQAQVAVTQGRYYGIPFSRLALAARLKGRDSEITAGTARVGGGEVRFLGTFTDDELYDGRATLQSVEIRDLIPARSAEARLQGVVSGSAVWHGSLQRPRLVAHLSTPRLALGKELLGQSDIELRGEGSGQVKLRARAHSDKTEVLLNGTVGAGPPHAAELDLSFQEAGLHPYLRLTSAALPDGVSLIATGTLRISGPLSAPKELHGRATFPSLSLNFPDYPIRNPQPIAIQYDHGRLTFEDCRLGGEGTDLDVSGSLPLLARGDWDLKLAGKADLRVLSVFLPRIRGRGLARLAMTASGSQATPQIDGRLDLAGAGLRVRGFPHGLDNASGSILFNETAAHFSHLTGTFGGGQVDMNGQANYAKGDITSFDIYAQGRGINLRYPEGLSSSIDGDLRYVGDSQRQWLTGDIQVLQSLWNKRYEVASELLAAPPAPEARGVSLADSLRYDVRIHVPGTFKVDNNLATLEAQAEFTLQGNAALPVLLGRASIERGRVYFQGNTYIIRHGVIDFANPHRIDPIFDVEAETMVGAYRVMLRVNGTNERVYPTLTSDPPLSTVQILTLLAGGDESAVANLSTTRAQQDQAYLAATGAASLAAGRLSEEVGLEKGAQRLLGLSRFSIDPKAVNPAVSEGDVTTTARLTVGKRISSDLNFLYSQDLGGKDERLLSMELVVSDRLSLILSGTQRSGEQGLLGFDVLWRHSKR